MNKTEELFDKYYRNDEHTKRIESNVANNKITVADGIELENIVSYLREGNQRVAIGRYNNASAGVKTLFRDMLMKKGIWKKV